MGRVGYEEFHAPVAWTDRFLSRLPRLQPWVSPGRVSLAPEPSEADRVTWDVAGFAARYPAYTGTLPYWIWAYLAQLPGMSWTLPDDPFDSTEWIREQRLRPYDELVRGILDDADLRLPRRR